MVRFPKDTRTYRINNQWLWGDKLMVTIGNQQVFFNLFKSIVFFSKYKFKKTDWFEHGIFTER